jgi:hypothetical protein
VAEEVRYKCGTRFWWYLEAEEMVRNKLHTMVLQILVVAVVDLIEQIHWYPRFWRFWNSNYPLSKYNTVTIGSGLTGSTATDGSDKVTTFTAGTGTISFS